ncbi:MAG: hypothetical protein H0U75_04800 [Legionella sp.]|nr:hypothetical protein [Legionella sp.]
MYRLIQAYKDIYGHFRDDLKPRHTALGAASGLTCTFILINEGLPEAQGKIAIAYSIVAFAVGGGLAVMFGGLITEYLNWQGCFCSCWVMGFLCSMELVCLVKPW